MAWVILTVAIASEVVGTLALRASKGFSLAGEVSHAWRNRVPHPYVCTGMGIFKKRRPALATVLDQPFSCRTCGHDEFWHREIKLNSTGMELLDLGWLNQSSRGLICARCGYVHEFVGDAVQLWKNERGE